MMMFDVVIIVRVPSMAQQRREDVRKSEIQGFVRRSQYAIVVDVVVKHEGVPAGTPDSEDQMRDGVEIGEVVVEVDRRREEDGEVEDDVRQENDVRGVPNDGLGEAGVGVDDMCLEPGWEGGGVPGYEDGGREGG
jgi:hypothetical protein